MASKKETAKPKLTSLTVDQKLEILDQIGKNPTLYYVKSMVSVVLLFLT